jgi:hypothetical protein
MTRAEDASSAANGWSRQVTVAPLASNPTRATLRRLPVESMDSFLPRWGFKSSASVRSCCSCLSQCGHRCCNTFQTCCGACSPCPGRDRSNQRAEGSSPRRRNNVVLPVASSPVTATRPGGRGRRSTGDVMLQEPRVFMCSAAPAATKRPGAGPPTSLSLRTSDL